jgi:hypothetical protein
MTLRERVVEVLERWCGDDVERTDEKLEDLWNRTKPSGNPSHSGIDYFPPGGGDLVDRVTAEYSLPRPEIRRVNFDSADLNPAGGTILTIDDLFIAVGQCPVVESAVVIETVAVVERQAIAATAPKKSKKKAVKRAAK